MNEAKLLGPGGVSKDPIKKILVVDDDDMVRNALRRTIRGIGKSDKMEFILESAPSVADAVRMIQGGFNPDVIFSDMMMPDETGRDFLERLEKEYPALVNRFCFVSGGATSPELRTLLEYMRAMGRMIDKPFEIHQIRHVIRTILELE